MRRGEVLVKPWTDRFLQTVWQTCVKIRGRLIYVIKIPRDVGIPQVITRKRNLRLKRRTRYCKIYLLDIVNLTDISCC